MSKSNRKGNGQCFHDIQKIQWHWVRGWVRKADTSNGKLSVHSIFTSVVKFTFSKLSLIYINVLCCYLHCSYVHKMSTTYKVKLLNSVISLWHKSIAFYSWRCSIVEWPDVWYRGNTVDMFCFQVSGHTNTIIFIIWQVDWMGGNKRLHSRHGRLHQWLTAHTHSCELWYLFIVSILVWRVNHQIIKPNLKWPFNRMNKLVLIRTKYTFKNCHSAVIPHNNFY